MKLNSFNKNTSWAEIGLGVDQNYMIFLRFKWRYMMIQASR